MGAGFGGCCCGFGGGLWWLMGGVVWYWGVICGVFVGLFGDEEFFNFGLELGVVLTVEDVFGDLLDWEGDGAIGSVLAGGVGDIRE